MERVLITELEASVRVGTANLPEGKIGEPLPEGSVCLTVLAYNQEVPVILNHEERTQIIAWLQDPNRPLVVQ